MTFQTPKIMDQQMESIPIATAKEMDTAPLDSRAQVRQGQTVTLIIWIKTIHEAKNHPDINTMMPEMNTETILCSGQMPLNRFHLKCIKLWARIPTLRMEWTEVQVIWIIWPVIRINVCKKTSEMMLHLLRIMIRGSLEEAITALMDSIRIMDRCISLETRPILQQATTLILHPCHQPFTTKIANTGIQRTMSTIQMISIPW